MELRLNMVLRHIPESGTEYSVHTLVNKYKYVRNATITITTSCNLPNYIIM